jgi:hypothetical protein
MPRSLASYLINPFAVVSTFRSIVQHLRDTLVTRQRSLRLIFWCWSLKDAVRKCSNMLDLDNLMVEEGYPHHASYTNLVASARSGCELCQCIQTQDRSSALPKLEDAFDQDMPAEDTQIQCYALDRNENVRGVRRIWIHQDLLSEKEHAADVQYPYLSALLQFSTAISMQITRNPRQFTFSFVHR